MSGATTGKMGIYKLEEKAYLNQRVGNLKINDHEIVDMKYRNFFFMHFSSEILKMAYGGAQPNISSKMIENLNFPLPPFKEQKRIIQKIESCFEKINSTQKKIEEVEILFGKHRSSLLVKAFNGRLVEQINSEGTGHELLEKILSSKEKKASKKKTNKK